MYRESVLENIERESEKLTPKVTLLKKRNLTGTNFMGLEKGYGRERMPKSMLTN